MLQWISDILFSPIGVTAIGFIFGWAGRMLAVHLLSRVGTEWLRLLLSRAWTEVSSVFLDVHKAYTLEMMRAKADGVVTDEEREHAKQVALDAAKKHLGWKLLAAHVVKILTGASLGSVLEAKADEALAEAEKAGADAVAEKPPSGVAGVIGEPEDVP